MFKQLFLLSAEPIVIFEKRNNMFHLKDANFRFLQQNKSGKTLDTLYEEKVCTILLPLLLTALKENKQVQSECFGTTFTVIPLSSETVAVMEKSASKEVSLCTQLHTVSDLVMYVDTNEIITEHSLSHETLIGFSKEDINEKSVYEFVHQDDVKHFRKTLLKVQKDNTARLLEWRMLTVDGSYLDIETSFSPVLNEQQELISFLLIGRDVTERKEYEKKLYHLAFHDPLTELPNRRLFTEQLKQTFYQYERKKQRFAIFLLDCDHFKHINDTYGHDIGDEVIKGFANRVKGLIRKSDILSRFGGDEFSLLLPEVHSKEDVEIIAKRIIEKIQEPWVFDDFVIQTTTSVGVFYIDEETPNVTMDNVLKNADIALYRAKNNGKNHFQLFEEKPRTANE